MTLANVTRLAVPYVADGCIVDMLEPDGAIRRVAVAGLDRAVEALAREVVRRYPPDPAGPHPVMVAIRTGQPIVLPDISDELLAAATTDPEHLELARGLGLRSAIVAPIRARGRTLGAVSFVSVRDARRFSDADLPFAEDLAHRAALAVDNARLYQEAERSRADAETANRAKDELLATLSHELRTTLTSVLGWGRLLRTGRLSPDARDRALDSIERNASAQVRLIEDLLDVSRIAAGKLELRVGPVEIGGTLAAAIDVVRPEAAAKDVRVEASIAPDLGVIRGDAARIEQIVWEPADERREVHGRRRPRHARGGARRRGRPHRRERHRRRHSGRAPAVRLRSLPPGPATGRWEFARARARTRDRARPRGAPRRHGERRERRRRARGDVHGAAATRLTHPTGFA